MFVSLRRGGRLPSSFVGLGADRPLAARDTASTGELTGGAANTQIPLQGWGHRPQQPQMLPLWRIWRPRRPHIPQVCGQGGHMCGRLWPLPDCVQGSSRTSHKTVAARSSPIERKRQNHARLHPFGAPERLRPSPFSAVSRIGYCMNSARIFLGLADEHLEAVRERPHSHSRKSVRAFWRARLKMRSDFGQPLVFSDWRRQLDRGQPPSRRLQVTPNCVSVWAAVRRG